MHFLPILLRLLRHHRAFLRVATAVFPASQPNVPGPQQAGGPFMRKVGRMASGGLAPALRELSMQLLAPCQGVAAEATGSTCQHSEENGGGEGKGGRSGGVLETNRPAFLRA